MDEKEKQLLITMANTIDELKKRVTNLESFNEVALESTKLEPAPKHVTVISKPEVQIELDFITQFPFEMLTRKGVEFQAELESLLKKHDIKYLKVNWERTIR